MEHLDWIDAASLDTPTLRHVLGAVQKTTEALNYSDGAIPLEWVPPYAKCVCVLATSSGWRQQHEKLLGPLPSPSNPTEVVRVTALLCASFGLWLEHELSRRTRHLS